MLRIITHNLSHFIGMFPKERIVVLSCRCLLHDLCFNAEQNRGLMHIIECCSDRVRPQQEDSQGWKQNRENSNPARIFTKFHCLPPVREKFLLYAQIIKRQNAQDRSNLESFPLLIKKTTSEQNVRLLLIFKLYLLLPTQRFIQPI